MKMTYCLLTNSVVMDKFVSGIMNTNGYKRLNTIVGVDIVIWDSTYGLDGLLDQNIDTNILCLCTIDDEIDIKVAMSRKSNNFNVQVLVKPFTGSDLIVKVIKMLNK